MCGMKKLIILLLIAGVTAFLWWSFKPEISIEPVSGLPNSVGTDPSIKVNRNPIVITDKAVSPAAAKVVVYENSAFTPAVLTISVGDKVIFKNNHIAPIRLASNPHPIHTSFPEFDSDTLAPGESYEFTFGKPMTLSYHNHFNPVIGGKIIVQ